MIHGATIRRPIAIRIAVERTTMPTTQAQAGTVRTTATSDGRTLAAAPLATKPDLAKARRELVGLRAVDGDPDVRGRVRALSEHSLADGRAADRLLERGHVPVGDAAEVVLAADVLAPR